MNRSSSIFKWLLMGTVAAVNAFLAALSITRGDYLMALIPIGAVTFVVGLLVLFVRSSSGRIVVRGECDSTGTTLRLDRVMDIAAKLLLAGTALAGLMLAIFAPLGMVEVPEQARLQLPFVGGMAALVTVPLLVRTLWRGSYSYLFLSPLGFEIAEGWRSRSGQWSEVRAITDADPNRPKAFKDGVVITLDDGTVAGMSAGAYTPGGTAVRELVRFYWQNRTHRDELTDARALKRLAENRFEAS